MFNVKRFFCLFCWMILLVLMSACSEQNGTNDDTDEGSNDYDQIQDEQNNDNPNDDDQDDDNPNDDDQDDAARLAAVWSWVYGASNGNTTGNLLAEGLVTYDFNRKNHYISAGNKVYAFNVTDNTTRLLFTTASGQATYLNVAGAYLYYINDDTHGLYRYDFNDDTITKRLDDTHGPVYYLHRAQTRYHLLYEGRAQVDWGLYSQTHNGIMSRVANISTISEYGGRVYLRAPDNLIMQMRDGGTGAGTSIWAHFERDYEATMIGDYLVLNLTDYVYPNIAMVLETSTARGLVIYHHQQEPTFTIIHDTAPHDISNLNFDGTHLYYLHQQTYYKVPLDNPSAKTVHWQFSEPVEAVFMVNHWLYYQLKNSGTLYQVHPDSNQIHPFNP